ncbi:peptidase [Actinoplanes sp. CA-030573]|uniref:peptidase n=1 Tax=Actinoplanes sp. CA-030573 TaxID=3239898 RepID=UPI003D93A6CD
MKRTFAAWARVGTGIAVVATSALLGAPTAAHAADPLPDLSVSFDRDPVAEIDNSGTTVGVYLYNNGEVPATAVTLTLDVSKLSEAVTAAVPESNDQCALEAATVTCRIGRIDPLVTQHLYALDLASRAGAPIGPAGEVTVSIDGAEDDANPGDDSTTFPVTVIASGPDLAVVADDLNTAGDPVGPGDEVPLLAAVGNEGDTAAVGATITLDLQTSATVVERYSDCTYESYYPHAPGGDYVYGPGHVVCPLPALEPGEDLLLFDPSTGESVFTVTFGKNMPGPDENYGHLSAQLAGESRLAEGARKAAGAGSSFAAAVKRLGEKAKASKSVPAKAKATLGEIDESDNWAEFRWWSKPNQLDVRVSAQPVTGTVGQTADLKYEIVNQGPSDGGGPSVLITAPAGTVLLPAEWCWTDGTEHEQKPESARLRCSFESEFPSVASGFGRIGQTLKLKIKSTPGSDGTILAQSCCVGSTETDKADNTARIVFAAAGGSGGGSAGDPGSGGSGGGLPITGTPIALIAAIGGAVMAAGIVLAFVFRRRKVVLRAPGD